MRRCDKCGNGMISTELRWADDGVHQTAVDCCDKCGEPLESVPDGYTLNENHIA